MFNEALAFLVRYLMHLVMASLGRCFFSSNIQFMLKAADGG